MAEKKLCLDVGNSNIKAGLFAGNQLLEIWSWPTNAAEKAAADLLQLGSKNLAISSVVPKAAQEIVDRLRPSIDEGKICFFEVKPLEQNLLSGMNPEMGADRVAEAVGAWCFYGQKKVPAIVMGFGTATTLLAISKNGELKGGYIAPGLSLMLEVLHLKCALLPALKIDGATMELGHDTDSHMKNGVFLGHYGMMKSWLDKAKQAIGEQAMVVATGHSLLSVDEEAALAVNKLFDITDHELALKGINYLFDLHLSTCGRS